MALLFLVKDTIPHESLWRRWFEEVDSLLYTGCMPQGSGVPAGCERKQRVDPIARQALYNVYVHSSVNYTGYPEDSVFHGARHTLFSSVDSTLRRSLVDHLTAPVPQGMS